MSDDSTPTAGLRGRGRPESPPSGTADPQGRGGPAPPHPAAYLRSAALALYIAVFLWVDHRWPSIELQLAMGIVTYAVLLISGAAMTPLERRQLCLLISIATAVELFSSQLWGVYRYRFGNVPFYIPPGHGIVFVLSVWLSKTPALRAAGPRVTATTTVLAAAAVWALAGVALLPHVTGRVDLEGALLWPVLCWCILRTRRAAFFASVFLVTSAVELYGVALGDWTWTPMAPLLGIPGGNPPSVIAGAYCLLDATVFGSLLAGTALSRLRPGALPLRTGPRWEGP